MIIRTKIQDETIEIIPYKEYLKLKADAEATERRRAKDRERKSIKRSKKLNYES